MRANACDAKSKQGTKLCVTRNPAKSQDFLNVWKPSTADFPQRDVRKSDWGTHAGTLDRLRPPLSWRNQKCCTDDQMSLFADLNIVKNSVVPVATCTKRLISLSSPRRCTDTGRGGEKQFEIGRVGDLQTELQDLRLDGLILLFAVQFETL
jgi:hypothetical protein